MTLEPPMIRVGLIGHGLAGALIHAPLIEAVGEFRISAVATSRPDSLASRRDAPRAVADPVALVEAEDVDLVVIASPNEGHADQAARALRAGKHVVVDKPFVLTTADADRLIALAAETRRMLTVFHNRRRDGDFRAVSEMLASGELGEVLLAEFCWDRFRPEAPSNWRNTEAQGAGVLWDLGPHLIDQALLLFGPPESFTADIAAQRPGAAADDYFELTFRYGERRCILSASSVVAAARPRFALHGTKGSFETFGVDPIEASLRAERRPDDPDFAASLPTIPARLTTKAGARDLAAPAGSWVGFYRDVAEAIRTSAPPPVDARDARAVTAIIEQALAQARAAAG